MTDLFLSPSHLADHLEHIVDGTPIREIARARKLEASTVLRRMRRIEDLRDHPDFDTLLTALEVHREDSGLSDVPDRAFVAAALGTDVEAVCASFSSIAQAMLSGGTIITGDMSNAGMMFREKPIVPIPRTAVLAALGFGWLKPSPDTTDAVRKFTAYPTLRQCTQTAAPAPSDKTERKARCPAVPLNPVKTLFQRRDQTLITADHVGLANEFHEIYVLRSTATKDMFEGLKSKLPPRTFQLLKEVCGRQIGFEETERKMGLPPRSAKALIAFSLEFYGLVRGKPWHA